MAYKNADKLSKKLRLIEEQKHGMVKQTNNVSTVITRGSANRDNRSKTTTAATKTYTAPKATTASSYKTGGTTTKYTATPKVAASVPKAPAVSTPAPKFTAPTVLTSSAKQKPKPTQKYDFEGYLSALSALETARAQSVQAQNTYLNTQGLIEKGKEFFRNSGNLAAAQADVQRIAAKNSASAITNLAKKAANNGAALQSAQANANRTAANTAASAAAKYGKNVWDSYSNNANAYSQSLARQGDATAAAAKNMAKNYSDSANNYSTALTQQGKNVAQFEENSAKFAKRYFVDSYRDFSNNPDAGKIVAQTLGVTGSDQTGASIYGYQNDASYKIPNDNWTSGEKQLYNFHLKNNPTEAEAYAIRTNDRHKQKKKNEKIQSVDDWMDQSVWHGAAAWMGARGVNLASGLDSYNNMLEYAATGRVAPSQNLSFSDFVETVDNVNERNISNRFGSAAGTAYRVGTDVTDAIISRGANYLPVAKLPKNNKIRLHDVNEAINAFNSGYLYAKDNGMSELASVGFGTGNLVLDIGVGEGLSALSKESFDEKDIARVFMEEPIKATAGNAGIPGSKKWFEQNDSEIQARKGKYMKEKQVSERTAWWMATKELLEESMK